MHRWHDVFHAALTRDEVVGVQAAIRGYLRREPTRAEMNAARRAAHRFAGAEPADLYHVAVNGTPMLVLARLGVEVDPAVAERAATRQIRPSRKRAPDVGRLLQTVERGVETAATAARRINLAQVDPKLARETAAVLQLALTELDAFHRRLTRRR